MAARDNIREFNIIDALASDGGALPPCPGVIPGVYGLVPVQDTARGIGPADAPADAAANEDDDYDDDGDDAS